MGGLILGIAFLNRVGTIVFIVLPLVSLLIDKDRDVSMTVAIPVALYIVF